MTIFVTLLLYSGIAFAFPSNLEIAFAKVSANIGHLDQTAGCVIIWSTGDLSSQKIYCRYQLNKEKDFLRDDDNGINLSKIKLYPSSHLGNLTTQVEDWLKKQYPKEQNHITSDEVIQIVMFMSNDSTNLKPDARFFGGKKPQTLLIYHLYEDLLKNEVHNKYKAQPERAFAYLVHRAIQEKLPEQIRLAETPESNVIMSNTLTNSPSTKLTNVITMDEIQNGVKQQKIYLIISAISIIIFAVFVLALFWFLLEKYNDLEKKIGSLERNFSDNFSQIRSDMIFELRKVSLQNRDDMQRELKNMHQVQEEFISSVFNKNKNDSKD
jgi:uncharacterized protein YdcH (DUF465 family)